MSSLRVWGLVWVIVCVTVGFTSKSPEGVDVKKANQIAGYTVVLRSLYRYLKAAD